MAAPAPSPGASPSSRIVRAEAPPPWEMESQSFSSMAGPPPPSVYPWTSGQETAWLRGGSQLAQAAGGHDYPRSFEGAAAPGGEDQPPPAGGLDARLEERDATPARHRRPHERA